jgi:acyl-CoA synthetase (AMP-forming)/AMP-acid ligase II
MRTLEHLFNSQLRRAKGRPALSCEGRTLSFDDIDVLTREKAPALRAALIESHAEYLPLLVDDSADSYIAVLTCLLYEIPFALIDGVAPDQRVAAMLSILGDPERGWWGPRVKESAITSVWRDQSSRSTRSFAKRVDEENSSPCFVITTSGSTGVPKGVVLEFRRLVATIRQFQLDESPGPKSSLSSFSPLHFSGGLSRLSRIFLGHHLHVFSPLDLSLREILRSLKFADLTHLQLPPQIGRLVAYYSNPDDVFLGSVTNLRMGSEGIRFEVVEGLKKYLDPNVVFWHGLGASEALEMVRGSHILKNTPPQGQVPLGKLGSGTKLVKLEGFDSDVRELWASENIAVKYLGQPELTAERFVTDSDGVRYWRSGDLVERAGDGQLYHRGRIDDVVKVRGMLASPSETTRVLLGLSGIRAAVTLPTTKDGNTRLVSHVEVREGDSKPSQAELRAALEKMLPAHLLPAHIHIHEKLPTNQRGKIDRTALKVDFS